MARWNCGLFERTRVDRAMQVMPLIAKHVPPRVLSALLRTWWNGWVTGRRFQNYHGSCMFGCPGHADSIEHYATCPMVTDFANRRLNLRRPTAQEERLGTFLVLLPYPSREHLDELARRAIMTTTVYLTHCWCKHKGVHGNQAVDVMAQQLHEATRGHSGATGIVRHAFVNNGS